MPEGAVQSTQRTFVSGHAGEVLPAKLGRASITMEHLFRLLCEAEERAFRAEKNAERICSKAIEAVRAAQLRVEQTEARARQVALHAERHIKLLFERVSKAEALPQESTEAEVSPFIPSPAVANRGRPVGRLQ